MQRFSPSAIRHPEVSADAWPVVVVVAAGVSADEAARTILGHWALPAGDGVWFGMPTPARVVVVPAQVRDWCHLALVDETLIAGSVWSGPPILEMVDLPQARERATLEAQLLLTELLEALHLAGLPAAGVVSPRPGLGHAARLAASEQLASAVAILAPRRLFTLRTLVARWSLRLGSPTARWIGAWAAIADESLTDSRI